MKTIKWAVSAVILAAALFSMAPTATASETGPYTPGKWHMVSRTNYNTGMYHVAVMVFSDGRHFFSRRFVY